MGRGDVVPGSLVFSIRGSVEIFLDKLLLPRKFVATAHGLRSLKRQLARLVHSIVRIPAHIPGD
jgi:hypothetical protein